MGENMSEKQPDPLELLEKAWKDFDNQKLIREAALKGNIINEAIKILAKRNKSSIDDAKNLFLDEIFEFIKFNLENKQIHRVIHMFKNLQWNEVYYLFSFYEVRIIKPSIFKNKYIKKFNFLIRNATTPQSKNSY